MDATVQEPVVVVSAGAAHDGRDRVERMRRSLVEGGGVPSSAEADSGVIMLPSRLPVSCLQKAEGDYRVPAIVMLGMLKAESRGRPVTGVNTDGSMDHGHAQINEQWWGRLLRERYGIETRDLYEPCQAIRAMAYVLRAEWNHKSCRAMDVWCAVARYHNPGDKRAQEVYLGRVRFAVDWIMRKKRFE